MNIKFQESIDATRPHTLMTTDAKFSGQLDYRYDDTGEIVMVPNIWYNQTFKERVAWIRYQAQLSEDFGKDIQRNGSLKLTPQQAQALAQKHFARAAAIRAEANRVEAQGTNTHPVAASKLELKFPDAIGID